VPFVRRRRRACAECTLEFQAQTGASRAKDLLPIAVPNILVSGASEGPSEGSLAEDDYTIESFAPSVFVCGGLEDAATTADTGDTTPRDHDTASSSASTSAWSICPSSQDVSSPAISFSHIPTNVPVTPNGDAAAGDVAGRRARSSDVPSTGGDAAAGLAFGRSASETTGLRAIAALERRVGSEALRVASLEKRAELAEQNRSAAAARVLQVTGERIAAEEDLLHAVERVRVAEGKVLVADHKRRHAEAGSRWRSWRAQARADGFSLLPEANSNAAESSSFLDAAQAPSTRSSRVFRRSMPSLEESPESPERAVPVSARLSLPAFGGPERAEQPLRRRTLTS